VHRLLVLCLRTRTRWYDVLHMNVLFVVAEMAPLVKVGGVGDVGGSLPRALRALGVDVRVALPYYATIERQQLSPQRLQAQVGPLFTENASLNADSARGVSASRKTHSSIRHSAGGSSPIAEDRNWFLTRARMPWASSTFFAWCTAARLCEL